MTGRAHSPPRPAGGARLEPHPTLGASLSASSGSLTRRLEVQIGSTFDEVTRGLMACSKLPEHWILLEATLLDQRASRREAAAGREIHG